jgi:hypothetical protein
MYAYNNGIFWDQDAVYQYTSKLPDVVRPYLP